MEAQTLTHQTNRSSGNCIRGMESVIATVSGYHGSERFKLIKLINHTGASYVGAMNKSVTHLVCWQFEGRKYDLANEFGIMIVSHRWFEDCVKAGKRLPERYYLMKSGQQVGSLLWEAPTVPEKENLFSGNRDRVLSDRSNTCNVSSALEISSGSMGRGSCLLTEKFSCNIGMNENIHKSRASTLQKKSKQACRSSGRNCYTDVPREESSCYSSAISTRHKRNIENVLGSSVMEPLRRSRRLVKKNSTVSSVYCQLISTDAATNDSNGVISENASTSLSLDPQCSLTTNDIVIAKDYPSNESGPTPRGRTSAENRNFELEDADDILELTDLNMLDKDVPPDQEVASEHGFLNAAVHIDGVVEAVGKLKGIMELPTSKELSCAICFTDFCSTRGILPCGHRFCYSCIQRWADAKASERKVPTCPLCKGSFMSITKVDDASSSDQKIYSQSIPCVPSTDIFVLHDWEISAFSAQPSPASVCCECRSREPEDLLISCHLCSNRWVHSYCLDPFLVPWTCLNCRDLRTLYQRLL